MQAVVEHGTARSAYLPNIPILGKTGTSQNPHGKAHSIFVCFAPREQPKIAIAVYVENAGYGSLYAAPIASLMIEKYMTDTIKRPWVEQRLLEADLLNN
jgi:penicillin-binding protein 2